MRARLDFLNHNSIPLSSRRPCLRLLWEISIFAFSVFFFLSSCIFFFLAGSALCSALCKLKIWDSGSKPQFFGLHFGSPVGSSCYLLLFVLVTPLFATYYVSKFLDLNVGFFTQFHDNVEFFGCCL